MFNHSNVLTLVERNVNAQYSRQCHFSAVKLTSNFVKKLYILLILGEKKPLT